MLTKTGLRQISDQKSLAENAATFVDQATTMWEKGAIREYWALMSEAFDCWDEMFARMYFSQGTDYGQWMREVHGNI